MADKAHETTGTGGTGPSQDGDRVAHILQQVQQLYTTRDTKVQDKIIDDIYHPNCFFMDNLFAVKTTHSLKRQMHAVAKMFRIVNFSLQGHNLEPFAEGADTQTLHVDTTQEYYMRSDKPVMSTPVKVTLQLNRDGKIVHHVDSWQGKWHNFFIFKRSGGAITSTIMKMINY